MHTITIHRYTNTTTTNTTTTTTTNNNNDDANKLFTLLDLCVSSLRRGHANLLCIVPSLTDDPPKGIHDCLTCSCSATLWKP